MELMSVLYIAWVWIIGLVNSQDELKLVNVVSTRVLKCRFLSRQVVFRYNVSC